MSTGSTSETPSSTAHDTTTYRNQMAATLTPVRIAEELAVAAGINPQELESLKDRMFLEILNRSVTDMAGNFSGDAEPTNASERPSGLERIFAQLKENLGYPADTALDFILGVLPGYSKGIVQTPHPTEMLSPNAIEAEEALMQALQANAHAMFANNTHFEALDTGQKDALKNALTGLHDQLTAFTDPLTVKDEMNRSVVFSERMFDAVPIIADEILQAAGQRSDALSAAQLEKFSDLVRAETWSPGDRDNKPLMTVNELEIGVKLNRRSMFKQYFRELATLGSKVDEWGENGNKDRLFGMMGKLLKTGLQYENGDAPSHTLVAKIWNFLTTGHASHNQHYPDIVLDHAPDSAKTHAVMDEFKTYWKKNEHTLQPYHDLAGDFIDDLKAFRDNADGSIRHIRHPGRHNITMLDSLIIQAGNFGGAALRSQIRQNKYVHEDVMKQLEGLLEKDEGSLLTQQGVEALVHELCSDPIKRQEIRDKVEQKLTALEEKYNDAEPDKKYHLRHDKSEKEHEKDFNFYQTMKGLQTAAENPDVIRHYLIAECDQPEHLLQAFALLKIMEPEGVKRHVEIVPLVEYPPYVQQKKESGEISYVEMMKAVMQNEHFRNHQQSVTETNYANRLVDASIDDGQVQTHSLTVGDVRRQFGIKPDRLSEDTSAEYDSRVANYLNDDRKIEQVKLCMGAGSDVTKAGGTAAAAVMQNAMEALRKDLLELDHPALLVDYIGCGGGVHRTQPVSSSYETQQGRSMRQAPENIAYKTLALLSDFVWSRIAFGDWEHQAQMPQSNKQLAFLKPRQPGEMYLYEQALNLGNMMGVPTRPDLWEQTTRPATDLIIDRYSKLYESDEYKALFSYSANPFAKLASYAARPTGRVDSSAGGSQGFPPPVDVGKLRAIEYGSTLNASGICASFYFGLGEMEKLEDDRQQALNRVMHAYASDPKMQDIINRATYGVIMADLDVAWKYVGEERKPEKDALETLKNSIPAENDRLDMAKKALADITLEHQKGLNLLVDIHTKMRTPDQPVGRTKDATPEQLLALLPKTLADQLETSRNNIKAPREALAGLFNKFCENGKFVPNRKDVPHFEDVIYPAMGTLMECFEHAPRAYTRPYWALEQEKQRLGQEAQQTPPHQTSAVGATRA